MVTQEASSTPITQAVMGTLQFLIPLIVSAEAWRAEVLQYIADNIPAIILTSAFVERLQSSWSLENLQACLLTCNLLAAVMLISEHLPNSEHNLLLLYHVSSILTSA